MELQGWTEHALRDALINHGLAPSYLMRGAIWKYVVNAGGDRERGEAESVNELMYLLDFTGVSAFDGYFNYCARDPEALTNDSDIYAVGGVGVVNRRIELNEVVAHGVITKSELERFNGAATHNLLSNAVPDAASDIKALGKRERETLLTIIGILCKEADIDYRTHAKSANLIKDLAATMGVSIGETTIENKLKLVGEALASHTK
jgi:hypothetical protein